MPTRRLCVLWISANSYTKSKSVNGQHAINKSKSRSKKFACVRKTDDHHLGFKIRDARRWLEDGMKVKARVRFRGREIQYPQIAREMLEKIWDQLQDIAIMEKHPGMEGNTMLMILAPSSQKLRKSKHLSVQETIIPIN